ncbi:TetR/AcrR family transcriptional regulator [Anaerobacillus sp. MEB173]|uniref:TetR/AcrR family transcriptional regulator n=1 Tax=Anaerobacillus sp. MEB173 TaxID=3383345 RepID=UPI003F90B2FF
MKKKKVPSVIKDQRLIEYRRNQIIKAAVSLFKQKGFHRTTTREISRLSGFSIGALYEYVGSKEDILFLVCDSIFDEVIERLQPHLRTDVVGIERLKLVIRSYYKVIDHLQDELLVMYQEAKSLDSEALPYVLHKNDLMTNNIELVIRHCVENGLLQLNENQIKLASHNIIVSGHMWAFRRWALQKLYTIDEYIDLQTSFLLKGVGAPGSAQEEIAATLPATEK